MSRRGRKIGTDHEVVEELQRICRENDGLLQPRDVVEEARKENSPLHSKFDWDDGKAAENWRLQQARYLITHVHVEIEGPDNKKRASDVFVSLSTDRRKGGYRLMQEVLVKRETRNQLIRDAITDMQSFETRYRTVRELVSVFSSMRKVREKLVTVK